MTIQQLILCVILILQTVASATPPDMPFQIERPITGTKAEILIQPDENISQLAYFWKLVIFLDLTSYHQELYNIEQTLDQVKILCSHVDSNIQEVCGSYLDEIINFSSQISNFDQLFLTDIDTPKRQRRGLVDGIGNLGKFLFGIMDSNDHDTIATEINDLINTQQNEKHLLLETTTLVKSSLNLFSTSIDKVERNEKELAHSIKSLQDDITQTKWALSDTEYQVKINTNKIKTIDLLSHISASMKNFISDQKDLLQLLANLHHVPNLPVIIKPSVFKTKLYEISKLLPKDNTLPIIPTLKNLYWYYQYSSVDTLLKKDTIMIQLGIPISELTIFNLYHLFPIPTQHDGSIFEILSFKPQAIAISKPQHSYLTLSKTQLSSCLLLPSQSRLCHGQHVYDSQQHPSCETQWLTKLKFDTTVPTMCSLTFVNISDISIMETNSPNVWIFAVPKSTITTIISQLGLQFLENLQGSGSLTLAPGATAIIKGITLKSHPLKSSSDLKQHWNSSVPMKFPTAKLLDTTIPNPGQVKHMPKLIPLWDHGRAGQLKEHASELHDQINRIKIQELGHSMYSHNISFYILISMISILLIWLIVNKYLQHLKTCWYSFQQKSESPQSTPKLAETFELEIVEEPSVKVTVPNPPSPYPRARYV